MRESISGLWGFRGARYKKRFIQKWKTIPEAHMKLLNIRLTTSYYWMFVLVTTKLLSVRQYWITNSRMGLLLITFITSLYKILLTPIPHNIIISSSYQDLMISVISSSEKKVYWVKINSCFSYWSLMRIWALQSLISCTASLKPYSPWKDRHKNMAFA